MSAGGCLVDAVGLVASALAPLPPRASAADARSAAANCASSSVCADAAAAGIRVTHERFEMRVDEGSRLGARAEDANTSHTTSGSPR